MEKSLSRFLLEFGIKEFKIEKENNVDKKEHKKKNLSLTHYTINYGKIKFEDKNIKKETNHLFIKSLVLFSVE